VGLPALLQFFQVNDSTAIRAPLTWRMKASEVMAILRFRSHPNQWEASAAASAAH